MDSPPEVKKRLTPAQVLNQLSDGDQETKRFIFEDLLHGKAAEWAKSGYKPSDMLPLLRAENRLAGDVLSGMTLKRMAVQVLAEEKERLKPGSPAITPLEEAIRRYEEEVESWGSDCTFEFGIPLLDDSFGGIFPGETMVIVGQRGAMKTSLMLNGVENYLRRIEDGKVLFYSLDMKDSDIAGRLMCRRIQVDEKFLRRLKERNDPEYLEARRLVNEEFGRRFVPKANKGGFRYTVERLKREVELEMPTCVCIDYLTKLKQKGQSDLDTVSDAMPVLVEMAQEYGIHMVIASQMSQMSQRAQYAAGTGGGAKGGGDVEDMAYAVIDLFRDFPAPGGAPNVIATVSKTRRGVSGKSFSLGYWGTWMQFDGTAKRVERKKRRDPIFDDGI